MTRVLVNPYHIAHKNRGTLKGFAMEVKITNSDLPLSQHDTGSVNLELLYAELAAMRQLVETLTLTTKELKATIKEQTAAIQKQDKTIEEQNKEIRKLTNDVEWLKDENGKYRAKLVGSMVNLRRYFFDIYGAHQNHIDKESEEYQVSKRVVELIGEVFRRDGECSAIEERTKLRQSDDFRRYFEEIRQLTEKHFEIISESESPKGIYTAKFIKAVKYSHNQWEKLHQNPGGRRYSSG